MLSSSINCHKIEGTCNFSIAPRSHYDVWVEKYGKEEADKRLSIKKEKIRNTVTGRIYSKERRDKSAQGHKGIKMTKESSDKKSVSMIGKNAGKTHTIETKLKMQENLASPEVQAKMRKPRSPQGKENMKKSEQTRENMRNAWKKRKEQHG